VPCPDDLASAQRLTGGPKSKTGNGSAVALAKADRKSKILLHPGSRSAFASGPPSVRRRLRSPARRTRRAGLVVAGPAEQALVGQIRAHAKTHLIALEQRLNVGQFAALLAQFDLFVCHDSGPMHIAAAVGTPVVALFGSQNATIWRPLGDRHAVLQTSLPCVCFPADAVPGPCVRDDSYRSYCVRQLDVETVFAAVAARINGRTAP